MSKTTATLKQIKRKSLDQISIEDAQKIRRRILNNEHEVKKVEVAAFGSFI